jgi:cell surface protein SprA
MMKNVYSLSAFQVDKDVFRLDILYMNDETGVPIPCLAEGNLKESLLVRVMGLDRVNLNNDPYPDGLFDFVDGITIDQRTGRIFFPVLEPFGSNLADSLANDALRERYVFQELYDSTRFKAQEQTTLNKFLLRGRYKSASGSEISLNAFNIPRGSVTVTAGGTALVENQDYTVDYSLGRVKILNEGILNSGVPIKVNFENNTLFNFQTKTFMGLTFDHRVSDNFNVGGSILNLRERPLTQKVNIGDEPVNYTIWGLNSTYKDEAPYLTRFVDAIPFIDTKEKSDIQMQGEFAHLIPSSPSGIKINGEETTYIDDFENSQTTIDIRGTNQWVLASTPGLQPDLFPESDVNNNQEYNYNRGKLAWYVIDPLFFNNNSSTPQNIKDDPSLISNHYTREVLIQEVFPNYSRSNNEAPNIAMMDLAYYPDERGPFNFDVEGIPGISSGTNADGTLKDPETRWAGIMRPLSINNFEEQNIEFIQFWILDPYLEDPNLDGGELYFNLGSVSEDILKDGRQAFENGLSPSGTKDDQDSTVWGYVPQNQPVVDAFSNEAGARDIQDVGLDALNDAEERAWSYNGAPTYLQRVEAEHGTGSGAYASADADPGADNFQYYRGSAMDNISADILRRYKNFNGTQGNSNTAQNDGYPTSATNLPDKEDVNRDQTLSKTETYFQYKVSLKKSDLVVGQNYITDVRRTLVNMPDESTKEAVWYQFKIPVFAPTSKVGPINDFRSIRFMRMFMTGFTDPVVLRFARLDLVRGEWRRYLQS